MLNTGRGFMERAPWLGVVPGMAMFIGVLGFNLLGDGLRDLFDPRMKEAS
jgi:peptide/nickel transport system permease protein